MAFEFSTFGPTHLHMKSFRDLNVSKPLLRAIEDLGFQIPTPVQAQSFSVIRSGKDVVGIAQTGTGKTFAYMLPLLQDLKFSTEKSPRVLILVPTRELVVQVVETIKTYAKYMSLRVLGAYGGVNINTQRMAIEEGSDILVATPGRLYDLMIRRSVLIKGIRKLVIDEVDVMLDLGFRPQLNNIFELLSDRRQNIMFSATMTDEVSNLIETFFMKPERISIAVSGTPLNNIAQTCYAVLNFNTKVNLLAELLSDKATFKKVLIFVSSKKHADRLFNALEEQYAHELSLIHSNKTQNYRIRAIEDFNDGAHRLLIATDVMARGLDLDKISHVINFDTPIFPENYMHRIGRTGRAQEKGASVLLYTEAERAAKEAIEALMKMEISETPFPDDVEINSELIPDERPKVVENVNHNRNKDAQASGPGFHEKKDKNKKVNLGGSYHRELAKKYKKAKTRGDKNANKRKKRGK